MKMELNGIEPYVLLFGMPIVIAAIVLVSIEIGTKRIEIINPPPPTIVNQVETPVINPRIEAVLPDGAVTINNRVDLPRIEVPTQTTQGIAKSNLAEKDRTTSAVPAADPEPQQNITMAQIPGKSNQEKQPELKKPELKTPEVMSPEVDDDANAGELLPPPKK